MLFYIRLDLIFLILDPRFEACGRHLAHCPVTVLPREGAGGGGIHGHGSAEGLHGLHSQHGHALAEPGSQQLSWKLMYT